MTNDQSRGKGHFQCESVLLHGSLCMNLYQRHGSAWHACGCATGVQLWGDDSPRLSDFLLHQNISQRQRPRLHRQQRAGCTPLTINGQGLFSLGSFPALQSAGWVITSGPSGLTLWGPGLGTQCKKTMISCLLLLQGIWNLRLSCAGWHP